MLWPHTPVPAAAASHYTTRLSSLSRPVSAAAVVIAPCISSSQCAGLQFSLERRQVEAGSRRSAPSRRQERRRCAVLLPTPTRQRRALASLSLSTPCTLASHRTYPIVIHRYNMLGSTRVLLLVLLILLCLSSACHCQPLVDDVTAPASPGLQQAAHAVTLSAPSTPLPSINISNIRGQPSHRVWAAPAAASHPATCPSLIVLLRRAAWSVVRMARLRLERLGRDGMPHGPAADRHRAHQLERVRRLPLAAATDRVDRSLRLPRARRAQRVGGDVHHARRG